MNGENLKGESGKLKCSHCHTRTARPKQRTCRECHAENERGRRARARTAVPRVPQGTMTLKQALAILATHRGRKTVSAL